jgi:hypothetical protein
MRKIIEKTLAGLLLPPLIDLVWDYYNDPNTIFLFLEPEQVEAVNGSHWATFFTTINNTASLFNNDMKLTCKAIGSGHGWINWASLCHHEYRRLESENWELVR